MSIGNTAQPVVGGNSSGSDFLANSVKTLLSPKNARGIAGFEFDIPDTEELTMSADATDNVVESGFNIHDHIVVKPVTFTLTGFVGEVVYRKPSNDSVIGIASAVTSRLGEVNGYLGTKSPQALQRANKIVTKAKQTLNQIDQAVQAGQNLVKTVSSIFGIGTSAQQKAYENLKAIMKARTLCQVVTPWEFFDNILITSVRVQRESNQNDITQISVDCKQLRITGTIYTSFNTALFNQVTDMQKAPDEQQGPLKPTPVDHATLAKQLVKGFQAGFQ